MPEEAAAYTIPPEATGKRMRRGSRIGSRRAAKARIATPASPISTRAMSAMSRHTAASPSDGRGRRPAATSAQVSAVTAAAQSKLNGNIHPPGRWKKATATTVVVASAARQGLVSRRAMRSSAAS